MLIGMRSFMLVISVIKVIKLLAVMLLGTASLGNNGTGGQTE